jgi:hypothetical protein
MANASLRSVTSRTAAVIWLAGVATVAAASLASAEEPPRISLQSSSDFASYGAFCTDLTATYSPFGSLWERGWRVQANASARRYSVLYSGEKRIGLDTTLDGLIGLVAFARIPGVAFAQDLPPPQTRETPPPPVSSPIQQFAIDGSAVGTSLGGRSVDVNATFAPFGNVNDTGFRVRLSGNASSYRFVTGDNPTTLGSGHSLEGGVLAGYQWSLPRISIIGLIGPTFAESNDDGVKRGQWGAKTVLSAYALPSDRTMAFGSISYSIVSNFLQMQAKAGVRLVGNVYVGPETIFSWRNVVPGTNNVAEMRLGGHISAVSFGPVQMGVSGGWDHQQNLGSGYYGSVNFYLTY